jgi:hypothetical protein
MYPDTAALHGRQAQGKAFADPLSVSRSLARAQPEPHCNQRQTKMKQQGVESSIHGRGVYQSVPPKLALLHGVDTTAEGVRILRTDTTARYNAPLH